MLIPRWLQCNVDVRKVIKEVALRNGAPYSLGAIDAYIHVKGSNDEEIGRIYWRCGRDYLAAIPDNTNEEAVKRLIDEYGLDETFFDAGRVQTMQMAASLKGLKTGDFDDAIAVTDRLYRALLQYPSRCEELKAGESMVKQVNNPDMLE